MSQEKNILQVNGMMKSPGDLECDEVNVNGMFKVTGDLKSNILTGDGMVKIGGNANADSININGMLKVTGDIDMKEVEVNGMIKANSMSGENIKISGKMAITENINCETLDFELEGNSSVQNIECSIVKVEHVKFKKHQLKVNTISADEIDVEYVECDTISGDKVKIGKGCNVNNVTYITSLEIDPNAKVKKSEKVV